jgi:argininosuccinate lyase
MGACAITTTGFAIDRSYTARMLGFEGLQVNSYGAIAAVDYLVESCSVLATCMLNLGRFTQDMMQWSSVEFGYLRLSDGYVQISSIMPQKRNPVPLEHVRILASKALAQSQAVVSCLHNTPFTDMNDAEDDLQPMAYAAFGDADRSLRLLAGALEEADFNTERMAACADANFLTVTELADTLVRSTGMSFRTAHEIVSKAVRDLQGSYDAARMAARVEQILAEQYPQLPTPDGDLLRQSLRADHFVAVRKIDGGPAPEALEPEIKRARELVIADQQRLQGHLDRFEKAREQLHEQTQLLLVPGDVS